MDCIIVPCKVYDYVFVAVFSCVVSHVGRMELSLASATLVTIRHEDSEPCFVRKKTSIWACLGVYIPRNPYWASEGKHLQQPTMPYHPTLTSFISSKDYIVFIVSQGHLNDH